MPTISPVSKLKQFAIDIRSSFWFVPSLLIMGAAALALGLIEIDQRIGGRLRDAWPRLFAAEAEGSRAMLSAIAGSMITVAGVVFSITIVALALASNQYTSRVLRNFMRDRANQLVLGVFVGIYTYCLLVLRTITSGNNGDFVPSLAVFGGVVLAFAGIGFLIFFIHHIATSIQAGEIIAAITRDTIKTIERLFPRELGSEVDHLADQEDARLTQLTWRPIPAATTGYIQGIDAEGLLAFAREHGTVLRMECGIGDFVTEGRPLASLALDQAPDDAMILALNQIYATDSYRTTDQDVEFGLRQLVDIALKALSPAINDTTTAVTCLEYLSVVLRRCAGRHLEPPYRFDHGELRVIAHGLTFERLVALAFDQILENAEDNTAIITKMLAAIEQVAEATRDMQRRRILIQHVHIIAEVADRSVKSGYARRTVEEHVARVRARCGMEAA